MHDVIIIGAGPAGLTASLYAGRYRLDTLVLEKLSVGGQIILSSTIENFPGFPGGISTQELIERFKKQTDELQIKILMEEVREINFSSQAEGSIYNITTKEGSYQARSVIIASGAQPKKLGVDGEGKFTGRGVSYCATCDAPLFKNKDVVVIGAGDKAIEEALFLAGYASTVSVIHRRDTLRASKILEEKARANKKIRFLFDSVVEKIEGSNKVEAVKVKNVKTESISLFACQGVFIFVGIMPYTDFLKQKLEMDESGFIITDQDLHTSQKGIFACGDCRKKSLYQVINACAEGAVAAASAHRYLI
jgi:thioredoxin reductase (NADPH)